jgi:SAM-dependent methyltransferase
MVTTRYKCGCQNAIHEPTGAAYRVHTCFTHAKMSQVARSGLPIEYYKSLGAIENGVPNCKQAIDQLTEALGEIGEGQKGYDRSRALEVGCGLSRYAPEIIQQGYWYIGIDDNRWAVEATRNLFNVDVIKENFETHEFEEGYRCDIILSAHSLEHMNNAPKALEKMYKLLVPSGLLYLLVPDDGDPVNPDHLWFFKEASLRKAIELAGFTIEKFVTRKYIERESFYYVKAKK